MGRYQALLLVSFGAPERAEDVMAFLRRVVEGREVPEERLSAVAEHYYQAGGRSPLNQRLRDLLSALGPGLAPLSLGLYWGNRNWHPFLEDTVAQMRDEGVERGLAFVTSAYGGYSSCRQYLEDIARARAKAGPRAPAIDKLRLYYNHPAWVEALAANTTKALARCREEVGRKDVTVVFSAHSIPETMAATSPYTEHVRETAKLVALAAGLDNWQLAWQSRSGSPSVPWVGPDIQEVVASLPAAGVVVVPIGFALENMEVLHDLDVEVAEVAMRNGAAFVRADCASSHPAFARMVLELVHERLSPAAPRQALGELGRWPDECPAGHCPPPARLRSG
jgi:ferrochelatase